MKILIINTGSSSLKYQLIDKETDKCMIKGHIDGIGLDRCFIKYSHDNGNHKEDLGNIDYDRAIELSLNSITENRIIDSLEEIKAVGHRVVHGGEYYSDSVIIDDNVIEAIDKLSDLAPLHNPPNLKGIKACMKALPNSPHIAVFDTAFHQTLPEEAYLYAVPYKYYKENREV